MKKLRLAAVALVVLAVLALACGGGGGDDIPVHGSGSAEVRVTNNSGQTIWYLYISPTSESTWGEDQLGGSVMSDGETHIFRVNPGDYDLRADASGNTVIQEEYGVSVNDSYSWTVTGQ